MVFFKKKTRADSSRANSLKVENESLRREAQQKRQACQVWNLTNGKKIAKFVEFYTFFALKDIENDLKKAQRDLESSQQDIK